MGLLWQHFRDRFPTTEDLPPLDLPLEREREGGQQQPTAQLELMSALRFRTWFVSVSGTEVIQVQHDRFAHNWRRGDTDEDYPRYESIREAFAHELVLFDRFLREQQIGRVQPKQCEVTYVNQIVAGPAWASHGDLPQVFRFLAPETRGFLPTIEDGRFLVRYVIRDQQNAFNRRLHVSVQPAFRTVAEREEPSFIMTLTARGRPTEDSIAGALGYLDLGREWVVQGFAEVTTEAMHEAWGRRR